MGAALVPPVGRTTLQRVSRVAFGGGAWVAFAAAVAVLILGVIATHGVYGSRMAWLLGVVLPLLVLTAGLSWLARRSARLPDRTDPTPGLRVLTITALVLLALPFIGAAMLLATYAAFFVLHGLGLLH